LKLKYTIIEFLGHSTFENTDGRIIAVLFKTVSPWESYWAQLSVQYEKITEDDRILLIEKDAL
jgi:hypothetical protein